MVVIVIVGGDNSDNDIVRLEGCGYTYCNNNSFFIIIILLLLN